MNFNDINALDAAAQVGLGGLDAKSYRIILSERENHVLSNVASFFSMVTASRSGCYVGLPKPLSALHMMTTDHEGRSFFGPKGLLTKSFASMRAAGMPPVRSSGGRPLRFVGSSLSLPFGAARRH